MTGLMRDDTARKRWRRKAETSNCLLVRQFEVDGDCRLNLDWVAVEQIGFVLPLFHRVQGGLGKKRVAADNFYCGNASGFSDGRHKFYDSLGAHAESIGRIRGLDLFQQKALGNSLRNGQGLKYGLSDAVARSQIG